MGAANFWLWRHPSRNAVYNKQHVAAFIVQISILEYVKIAYYFYLNIIRSILTLQIA